MFAKTNDEDHCDENENENNVDFVRLWRFWNGVILGVVVMNDNGVLNFFP